MFHLLFVPRYRDYVRVGVGVGVELLRPVKEVDWRDFFILPLPRHSHPVSPIR